VNDNKSEDLRLTKTDIEILMEALYERKDTPSELYGDRFILKKLKALKHGR
jgi:hypothetical protein